MDAREYRDPLEVYARKEFYETGCGACVHSAKIKNKWCCKMNHPNYKQTNIYRCPFGRKYEPRRTA